MSIHHIATDHERGRRKQTIPPRPRPPGSLGTYRPYVPIVVLTAVLAVVPLVVSSAFYMSLAVSAALLGLVAAGFNLTVGTSGLFAIAQHAFAAIGAYAVTVAVSQYDHPYLVAVTVALALGVVVGIVMGLPASRLSGIYYALGTFALAELVLLSIEKMDSVTGGAHGTTVSYTPWLGWSLESSSDFYLAGILLLGLASALHVGYQRTGWGRDTIALRENEPLAAAVGISPLPRKIVALVLGGAIGVIGGTLYAANFRFIEPSTFGFLFFVDLFIIMIIGGRGLWFGPYLGALIVIALPEVTAVASQYRHVVLGVLTIMLVLLAPTGLGGLLLDAKQRVRRRRPPAPSRQQVQPSAGEPTPLPHASPSAAPTTLKEPSTTIMAVEGLSKHYGGVRAVQNVTLEVRRGEIFGMVGPNGAGKTTLFDSVVGTTEPTSGTVRFQGVDVTGRPPPALARDGIVRSFQSPLVFPELTVREAIATAERQRHHGGGVAHVEDVIEQFGLAAYRDTRCVELPAGVAKLVGVTIAVAAAPTILLLDEPAAGLSHAERRTLIEVLQHLRRAAVTVWLVEHDMSLVTAVCDRLCVLDQGALIAVGPTAEVMRDPVVISAYLGQ